MTVPTPAQVPAPAPAPGPVLVADIGGTNARFALARSNGDGFELLHVQSVPADHRGSLLEAVSAYLETCPERPTRAVLAVAGPVADGAVTFINSPWHVSVQALAGLGLTSAHLLNDFEALAWALPHLDEQARVPLGGPPQGLAGATLAVLGPGTGFGVSALVRNGTQQLAALSTEGGHVGLAPVDPVEDEVVRLLRARFGRASIERILCGPGLVTLHGLLAQIEGRPPPDETDPATLSHRAMAEPDSPEAATLNRFCAILGSVAGDIALTTGARGGVFIGGGIAPRILPLLQASAFRDRFEDKGRYRDYMAAIPTWVITHPQAPLLGAAHCARTVYGVV